MLTVLELGLDHHRSPVVPDVRTPEQYDAVEKIVKAPGFLHASSNPFTSDLRVRIRETILFIYYCRINNQAEFRAVKITPKGKIVDITPAK